MFTLRLMSRAATPVVVVAVLLAVVLSAAVASTPVSAGSGDSTIQRPLSDWLTAQGDRSVFFPPVPDLVGAANGDDPPHQPPRFALADYTGIFNAWIQENGGPNLGTTVTGMVTEQPLANGRARVHVVTHSTDSLVVVTDMTIAWPGPTIFGALPYDVAINGATAALGETTLDLIFTNTAPGEPLPNLVLAQGNYCWLGGPADCPPPGVEVESARWTWKATGELHAGGAGDNAFTEGALGRFQTNQKGFDVTACTLGGVFRHVGRRGGMDISDCFAVETMFLGQIGQ